LGWGGKKIKFGQSSFHPGRKQKGGYARHQFGALIKSRYPPEEGSEEKNLLGSRRVHGNKKRKGMQKTLGEGPGWSIFIGTLGP